MAAWLRGWPPTWLKLPIPTRREPSGVTSILLTFNPPPFCGVVNGTLNAGSTAPDTGLSRATAERLWPPICWKDPDT